MPLLLPFSSVLVVDGDQQHAAATRHQLEVVARRIEVASCPTAALAQAAATHPQLILVDMRIASDAGPDFLDGLKQASPACQCPLFSETSRPEDGAEAVRRGAAGMVSKPLLLASVLDELNRAANATTEKSLALRQWEFLQAVVSACAGNRSEAARRMRIQRRSLQRMLDRPRPRW